jgi:hypothetical protein
MVAAARRPAPFQKAQREAIVNSKTLQRHVNKVWNAAGAAPMFRKEIQKQKDGKPIVQRRSVRLIQGHAYNIAMAGAVQSAVRDMKVGCDKWGIDYPQSTPQPWMLGMPKGSKLMLEQFLSAYVATGVLHATRMMKQAGKHKRLNKEYLTRAFEHMNEGISGQMGVSRNALVVPLKVKKAAAAGTNYEGGQDEDAENDEEQASAGDE